MDSTGLSVLVKAHQRADEGRRRLYLVKGTPQVQRLLPDRRRRPAAAARLAGGRCSSGG